MAYLCLCIQATRRATTKQKKITGSNSSYDNQSVIIILPVYLLQKKKKKGRIQCWPQIPKNSHMHIFLFFKGQVSSPYGKVLEVCVVHAYINPDSWGNVFAYVFLAWKKQKCWILKYKPKLLPSFWISAMLWYFNFPWDPSEKGVEGNEASCKNNASFRLCWLD